MKTGVVDLLRRGLDNTIANWPLLLIRVGEIVFLAAVTIGAVFAVVIPIVISVGFRIADINDPESVLGAMSELLTKWTLLLWLFAVVFVLLTVFLAVHSFVVAGCVRVYADGERKAGPGVNGLRARYDAFSFDRWLAGAKSGWWAIFWIYNGIYAVGAIILLIPLIPTAGLMLIFRENPAAMAISGCVGLVFVALLGMAVAIVLGLWTNRAIVEWSIRRSNASDSLAVSWAALRADPGRHVLIALAILVVALAGSTFFAGMSFGFSFGNSIRPATLFTLITMPARLLVSLASWFLSAAISGWYLAAYEALALERRP